MQRFAKNNAKNIEYLNNCGLNGLLFIFLWLFTLSFVTIKRSSSHNNTFYKFANNKPLTYIVLEQVLYADMKTIHNLRIVLQYYLSMHRTIGIVLGSSINHTIHSTYSNFLLSMRFTHKRTIQPHHIDTTSCALLAFILPFFAVGISPKYNFCPQKNKHISQYKYSACNGAEEQYALYTKAIWLPLLI